MQKLFEKARSFVYRNARPVDFARWQYHFEGGSSEAVVRALESYQNPDGGFGHGLEADCLNPDSTPIQTWCATTYLREISLYDRDHPVVAGIVRYLESGASFDGHCWAWAVPGNNQYPHASWWTYEPIAPDAPRNYNPTASLAGWLLRVTGSDFARRLAHEAVAYYLSVCRSTDMHLLPCMLTLYQDICQSVPEAFDTAALEAGLRQDISACVSQAADSWGGYCAFPSDFISGMGDPFYSCFPILAQQECDFIVRTQEPSGAWPVPWNWGAYPDEFAVSANHWKSNIILKNLLYLRKMGELQ